MLADITQIVLDDAQSERGGAPTDDLR